MLRINRLRIEIKTANESNGGVYGFDERFSSRLKQFFTALVLRKLLVEEMKKFSPLYINR